LERTETKEEIKKLKEELEQRVLERTRELAAANEELRREIVERRGAKALLQAREQEFQAIVENAPDQIIRYDREFCRTYVNPAAAKAYGLPAEALIGKPIGSVIRDAGIDVKEENLALFRQRITAVFDTGKSCEYELNWSMPTGDRYYSVRLFPEVDLNGSVINVLGIARDITERKRAENELRAQKEILQKIFDHIPLMIVSVGESGRVELANREWERTIGWSLEEIQEQNLDIYTECFPETQNRQKFEDFLTTANGEWADFKVRVRDGRVMVMTAAFLRLSGGTSLGIGQDITERKRAEEALRESQQQYESLVQSVDGIVWEVDAEAFRFTFVSKQAERILGYPVEQWLNEPNFWAAHLHPDDHDWALGFCVDATQRRADHQFEYRMIAADGRMVWLRDFVTVAVMEDQSVLLRGVMVDITEGKRAEEQLRATSEQLRALTAKLSSAREEESTRIAREIHDELGAALSSLRWDLEDIDEVISEATDLSHRATVRQKIEAMMRLTDTTVNTVRRIASELRPIALDELGLIEAIEWQAEQFQGRTGILCQCDCTVENLALHQEVSTAIFRIFQEALTNILRHAQATRVDITLRHEAGEFVLLISDNGKGITEHEKSASQSLGLLGMRERAHLIGGKINITGMAGEGTSITVRVPISG
jgi:PAS domain S-box-containing protein